jgi:hypothetical protein
MTKESFGHPDDPGIRNSTTAFDGSFAAAQGDGRDDGNGTAFAASKGPIGKATRDNIHRCSDISCAAFSPPSP